MADVREFGAKGDGKNDDTAAIEHAVREGDGRLQFPPGTYVLSKTIDVPLASAGRFGIEGSGGTAKLKMTAAGPALRLRGTHAKTALPEDVADGVWKRERMPTIQDLEIEGAHPEADGILLEGTFQATLSGVLLRKLRHGVRVQGRARNLLITHCQIFDLSGVGVSFDELNLHQAIISASHISYCRVAGIRIRGCEIRNLQITGNDIEYNFAADQPDCADILIDCRAKGSSVREGTIVSNTIQAKYSPGGANVRMLGSDSAANHQAGMFTISGNLIGSQDTNVHLDGCRGVVVADNVIYSGHRRNLLIERSRNCVISANSFDHNPDYGDKELATGIRLVDSRDVQLSACSIQDAQAGKNTVAGAVANEKSALLEIERCRRINVTGCQFLEGTPHGVRVESSSDVAFTGCMFADAREPRGTQSHLKWSGEGRGNFVSGCRIGSAAGKPLDAAESAGVTTTGNLIDGA